MSHVQIRRALSVLALTSTLFLVPAGSADAGIRTHRSRAAYSASLNWEVLGSRLCGWLVQLYEKGGVKIDPEGNH
jgi:hypothetical protein